MDRIVAPEAPLERRQETKTMTTVVVKTITAGTQQVTTTAQTLETDTKQTTTKASSTSTQKTSSSSSTSLPTVIPKVTETVSDTTLALAPTISKSGTESLGTGTLAGQLTSSSLPRPGPTGVGVGESQPNENDVVVKAGIAIGVLSGVLAVFVLVWVAFRMRRKKVAKARMPLDDDEKINGPMGPSNPFADSNAIRTPTTAPRLSLRPVTQFLPNLGLSEKRTSKGANLMLSPDSHVQSGPLHKPKGGSAWERPTVSSVSNTGGFDRPGTSMSVNSGNPFNDNQRIPEEPAQSRPISPVSPAQTAAALVTPSGSPPRPVSPMDAPAGAPAGAAGAAPVGLVRKASMRKDLPRPLDLTMPMPLPMSAAPPSPAGTEFSVHSVAPGQNLGPSSSAAAIAAAGGPPQSTVHRVTLDFKPTLEDEMGLSAGQLVRLLHEYDDGWVSCS